MSYGVLHCPVTCDVCAEQVERLDALKFGREWLCEFCWIKCDSCCEVLRHSDATVVDGDRWCTDCVNASREEA